MAYQEVDINAFGEDVRHFNNPDMNIPVQRINGGDMDIPERDEQRADNFPPDPNDIMNNNPDQNGDVFDDDDDFALDFGDNQGNNFAQRDDPQAAFPQITRGQMLLNRIKWFIKDNWKKLLIVLSIIIVIAVVLLIPVLRKEGYIKIPFIDGTTGYIKHIKDKSENKASAIIEDANGNIIYSQTTQPVSRLNYDYEQMLPEESTHGAISIEAI